MHVVLRLRNGGTVQHPARHIHPEVKHAFVEEQETLVKVPPSRHLKFVIPPFIKPSEILCPHPLTVLYVAAVVDLVVPQQDERRHARLLEYA